MYLPNPSVVWSTPEPDKVVAMADATLRGLQGDDAAWVTSDASQDCARRAAMIKRLWYAGQSSVLEHAACCMRITDISKAALDELLCSRHASYTVTSQRLVDHDGGLVCGEEAEPVALAALETYHALRARGLSRDEARQVLPNAAGVSLIMTANAHAWAEIVRQNMCRLASPEMQAIAQALWGLLATWFPALYEHVGPDCYVTSCRQRDARPQECRSEADEFFQKKLLT